MKRLLLILILTLSFQTLTKAEGIKDFEIEGITIGDSILDFYSEKKIKDNLKDWFLPKYLVAVIEEQRGIYDEMQLIYKSNDKKYTIVGISAIKFTDPKYCLEKIDNVTSEIEDIFSKKVTIRKKKTSKHPGDKSGKSKVTDIVFKLKKNKDNRELKKLTLDWINSSAQSNYTYNFEWLGRPIIQFPQDIIATQELIWKVKPDLIIETGIAHGGSIIFSASMLALLDQADNVNHQNFKNKEKVKRKVLGIDIDIRKHNLEEIKKHPFYSYIDMIEGSSISNSTIKKVKNFSKGFKNIMIFLDSNHTHDHVLKELRAYGPLTSIESYCIVFDTIIEDKELVDDVFIDANDNRFIDEEKQSILCGVKRMR